MPQGLCAALPMSDKHQAAVAALIAVACDRSPKESDQIEALNKNEELADAHLWLKSIA